MERGIGSLFSRSGWGSQNGRYECAIRFSVDGTDLASGGLDLCQQSFHYALVDAGKPRNVVNQHIFISLMDRRIYRA